MNSITDNTEFWTIISPFLSDKDTAQTEISVENKSNRSEVLQKECSLKFRKSHWKTAVPFSF